MERKVAFHVSKSDAAEGRWTVLPFEGSPIGELRDTEYAGLRGAQLQATSLHPQDVGKADPPRGFVPALHTDLQELPHLRRQIEGGNIAGHAEQLETEDRNDVADDYGQKRLSCYALGRACPCRRDLRAGQARLGDKADVDAGARNRSRPHSPPPASQK